MFVNKVMITGHRNIPEYNNDKITELIKNKLIELHNDNSELTLVSGMTLGSDTIAVELAIKLDIKFVAVIPFRNQHKFWTNKQKEKYVRLLNSAEEVIIESNFSRYVNNRNELYLIRNKRMVDMSDYCIAVFNGNNRTGTSNAIRHVIRHSKNKGIEIYLINPNEV